MVKDKAPYNWYNQRHGYWELYNSKGLYYKGNWEYDKRIGLEEWYNSESIVHRKSYYII